MTTVRVLSLLGSGMATFIVHATVMTLTSSALLGTLIGGICAFTLGIAAGRDGIWRD